MRHNLEDEQKFAKQASSQVDGAISKLCSWKKRGQMKDKCIIINEGDV